jgi:hypothetical protein
MSIERPLPRMPKSRAILIGVGFALVATFAVWLGIRYERASLIPRLLVVPVLAIIGYAHWRRCPQCHGRLILRRDYFPGTTQFRCIQDCPRCEIAWDTGDIGDDSAGGGG